MYHSVTFGEKNSWDDWHLIPTSRPVINPPQVVTNYVEIPGMDGAYDMTEWLSGRPIYKNRTGSLEFAVANDYTDWVTAYSRISNYLHGQSMRVILEDDPEYFYKGRMSVNKWKSDKWYSIITINYVLDPWKRNIHSTAEPWLWDPFNFYSGIIQSIVNRTISGTAQLKIIGSELPVIPNFIVTSPMTLSFNNKTYNLVVGTNTFSDVIFNEGENVFSVTGNGKLTVDYIGGSL